MKIALVHTALWGRGGAERQFLNLAIELQKLGNEVEIFTTGVNENSCYPELLKQVTVNVMEHNRFVPFKQDNDSTTLSFQEVGAIGKASNRLHRFMVHQFYMSGLPAMLSLGKSIPKGFDVINNHNPPTEWAAFTAKRRLKIPIVWMCNEPPSWYYQKGRGIRRTIYWPLFGIWDQISVKYVDKIIVLSHVAENLVKNAYGRPCTVVRTGFDAEKFHNVSGEEIRKKYGLENDFVLLQVANLALSRQSDSIKAVYYLSKKHSNIKLILDGAGSNDDLKRLCERLGVKEKVLFLHTKCDEELTKIYAACDVFLFPHQITWGLAVIEAMASEKSVIVAKGSGASEIIQNNVNGIVVENSKPLEIAKHVENLMANSSFRIKMGKNASEYVNKNLSWEKYARQMEKIFEEAIRKN